MRQINTQLKYITPRNTTKVKTFEIGALTSRLQRNLDIVLENV